MNIVYLIDDFKSTLQCCNCGYNKNSHALEFHHIQDGCLCFDINDHLHDDMKLLNIINKCAILCQSCHVQFHNSNDIDAVMRINQKLQPINTAWLRYHLE